MNSYYNIFCYNPFLNYKWPDITYNLTLQYNIPLKVSYQNIYENAHLFQGACCVNEACR